MRPVKEVMDQSRTERLAVTWGNTVDQNSLGTLAPSLSNPAGISRPQ